MKNPQAKSLAFNPDFLLFYGMFHGLWSSLDLLLGWGIHKFLNIDYERTHILTAGMEFGRKCAVLRNLAHRSNDPHRSDIINLIGRVQNESKRNVFAHAILVGNPSSVTFIDRTRGGDYAATEHTFTLKEWCNHVEAVGHIAAELTDALGVSDQEFHDFAMAALSTNTKSTKSPTPPSVKA